MGQTISASIFASFSVVLAQALSVVRELMTPSKLPTPGERLRAARKALGLSTAELGKRVAEYLQRPRPISASAIRNQENGTNGIPYSLMKAYSSVLGIETSELFFGRDNEFDFNPKTTEDEKWYRHISNEIFVPFCGEISSGWDEPTISNFLDGKNGIDFSLGEISSTKLSCYLVWDDSLEPDYRRGDILVVSELSEVTVQDGDHVLVIAAIGSVTARSLRQISSVGDDFVLLGIGSRKLQPMVLNADIGPFLDGVVVATVRRRREGGSALTIPKSLTLDAIRDE